MSPRSVILIVAALLVAGGTAFFVRSWLAAERTQVTANVPAPPPPTTTKVLVAKGNLPAGLFIRQEHLRWQPWPKNAVQQGYLVDGEKQMQSIIGAIVRRGIPAGQPIMDAMIARPGDRGFLAAVMAPGMRAISIPINDLTGISGLVLPGDRVDIILYHTIGHQKVSETVLENVRVLALGRRLDDQNNQPAPAPTATLELTPKQVEIISVAANLGRLSLSLRSLANPELTVAGAALAAADTGETQEVSAQTPAVKETFIEPQRGETYTRASDVSRLLGGGGDDGHRVRVYYGATPTDIRVDADDEEAEGPDETETQEAVAQ